MFDMDDFDNLNTSNHVMSLNDDDNEFLNRFITVTRIIKDTNFEDPSQTAAFIMHMINAAVDEGKEYDDKSLDVISALCSHVIALFKVIQNNKESYLEQFDNNVIIPMINSFEKNQ